MADTITQNILCKICGETKNLKRCGTCKRVYYCSREHQLKDWKGHKETCKELKSSQYEEQTGTNGMVYSKGNKCGIGEGKSNICGISEENLNIGKVDENQRSGNGSCLSKEVMVVESDSNDLVPFDNRPFRYEEFTSMPSNTSEIDIAKFAVNTLNEKGFCVIDGLFTKSQYQKCFKRYKNLRRR
ncbi:rho GTPase-activating protein gacZ-like [Ruditapes philippinarum]|uniref:rho GTPase-activating protein gacZ-like n=1 Tax=Ruditapes philippinarum TaxID=129788 RepID=UPI00295AEC08|nr:rho GTPase-activating protein gacZ-like [Ruditapes philippinarum]